MTPPRPGMSVQGKFPLKSKNRYVEDVPDPSLAEVLEVVFSSDPFDSQKCFAWYAPAWPSATRHCIRKANSSEPDYAKSVPALLQFLVAQLLVVTIQQLLLRP